MQHNQTHPVAQDPALDPLDYFVAYGVVSDMAPPDQNVGIRQRFLTQAVFGLVEGGGLDREAVAFQAVRDSVMDAIRVDGGNPEVGRFLAVFVPNSYAHLVIHYFSFEFT
jgi:hypothetical protein